MRQVHRAGKKSFIDFAGKKPSIVDPRTGEGQAVELFVSALGASSYVCSEAAERQDLPLSVAMATRPPFRGRVSFTLSDLPVHALGISVHVPRNGCSRSPICAPPSTPKRIQRSSKVT